MVTRGRLFPAAPPVARVLWGRWFSSPRPLSGNFSRKTLGLDEKRQQAEHAEQRDRQQGGEGIDQEVDGITTLNCLEGFQAQYGQGVRVFEVDLRLTADQQIFSKEGNEYPGARLRI